MSIGSFGENFPYTNFHDLNMDWVVKIVKDFLDQYTSLQNLIEEGTTSITNLTEEELSELQEKYNTLNGLLDEWYTTHDASLNSEFDSIMNSINAKYTEVLANFITSSTNYGNTVIDSIPSDYSSLSADVENLEINTAMSNKYSITENTFTLTSGGAIKLADGGVQSFPSSPNWCYSEYIQIPIGTSEIQNDCYCPSSYHGFAFYDSSKTFISGINDTDIIVPDNAVYFRFTQNVENTSTVNITYISTVFNDLEYISNGEKTITPIALTLGGAIKASDGTVQSFPSYPTWAYSDYVEIPPFTGYIYTNATCAGSTQGIAFYDDDKTFISDSGISGVYYSPLIKIASTYKYLRLTDSSDSSTHNTIYVKFIPASSNIGSGIFRGNNTPLEGIMKYANRLEGTFTLSHKVSMEVGQVITGNKCTVFVSDGGQIEMNNNTKLENIIFHGNWSPTRTHGDGTTYTQFGYVPILSYGDLEDETSDALFGTGKTKGDALIVTLTGYSYNTIIDHCIFENLDRLAVLASGQRHTERNNPVICNNYFNTCRMGLYVQGEFIRAYGNEYLACLTACYLYGGNSNNYGEMIKCCDVGYFFPHDAVAHNIISNCEVAHSGLAGIYVVYLNGTLGTQIVGCNLPDAPVVGLNVGNMLITGCRLDTWFSITNGTKNSIICNNIGEGYLYGNPLFSVPNDTAISMNRGLGTVPDTDVNT